MADEGPYARHHTANADPPALLWQRAFPGRPEQVREARHWIAGLLPACEPREILVQIASEFCANTIEHTHSGAPGGQFTVHLAWSARTARLTVGDDGAREAPAVISATLEQEHGRGLDIVDFLAADWGFAGDESGRWLWADVPWHGQGGPARIEPGDTRIEPGGTLPTAEAVRRLCHAYPGVRPS